MNIHLVYIHMLYKKGMEMYILGGALRIIANIYYMKKRWKHIF